MNKNLDDFFNEKLNDLSSSNDGWDEPSESVWANAQPNFPTYEKSKRNWLAILAILLGLTLLGTGTYLYKVKQANHVMKQEMAALNTQLKQEKSSNELSKKSADNALINQNETLQNQLNELQTAFDLEQEKTLQTVKNVENACIVSLDKAVENNTKKYQNIIQTYQQQIKQLEERNKALASENQQLKQPMAETKIDEANTNKVIENNPINELKNKSLLVENPSELIGFLTINEPKETWKKYEFGVDLSSMGFNLELTNSVKDSDLQSNMAPAFADGVMREAVPVYSIANAPSIGFHFGYGIKKDFYLRTGFRYANFNINNTYSEDIPYDQSNVYLDDQGTRLNDLVLNSSTPFNTIQQGITVQIPNGTTTSTTNDVLQSTLSNSQNYHFLQVPLGFAYYRGKKKLQLEFQGGLTWNHIRFDDYDFDASFSLNNTNLLVNRSSLISNTINTSTYLGGYLGLGANYRLSDSWQIRAGLTLEETGLRRNAQSFSSRYLLESGMNLSLNYRF
ncbi:MAG: hypothetical protein AB8G11_26485 [Saprospiraceae bacterium]